MLEDIIVECPVCGHPIDSHIDYLGKHIRCPECDCLWILEHKDIIQNYNSPMYDEDANTIIS